MYITHLLYLNTIGGLSFKMLLIVGACEYVLIIGVMLEAHIGL